MAAPPAAPGDFDVDHALGQAADLVRSGLAAFLEGNPFRGRKVQDGGRALIQDVNDWQDRSLSMWPQDEDEHQRRLALSSQVEGLARVARQLAGLAESRPSTQVQPELREAVQALAADLLAILLNLGTREFDAAARLDNLRQQKPIALARCAEVGRGGPRLFSSCLLAVSAVQRIEEAAEIAVAAGNLAAPLELA